MPTLTAIALDRLLEPGASKSVEKSVPSSMPVRNTKLERRNSTSTAKRKIPGPRIKPALYTTPEVTPLPDSPSSFPPSPYIVDHKRRGPRLLESSSEAEEQPRHIDADDKKVNGQMMDFDTVVVNSAGDLKIPFTNPEPVKQVLLNDHHDNELGCSNASDFAKAGSGSIANEFYMGSNSSKLATFYSEKDGESDSFYDPPDSMSFTSNTDGEDNMGTEHSMRYHIPGGEFYDAWEELSSEGGTQTSLHDAEAEFREMRLSLLMEIEKRKLAEESLANMRSQWESIRQRLSLVGIVLPAELTAVAEAEQPTSEAVEELCQQVHVARFVSNTIGRGTARAEVEMEMEAQLQLKDFEIARLMERLHFYETVNQEMSQRNQEAVEMARRERQRRRRRRQNWVWGSVATAIVLGTATIACSYLPMGRGSSSAGNDLVPEHDDTGK